MTAALLVEAATFVATLTSVSTTTLQRGLRVGFAKAAWLIDELETVGALAPANGTPRRDVLIDTDDLAAVLDKIRADAAPTRTPEDTP